MKSMNRRDWLKSTSKIAVAAAVAPLVFSSVANASTADALQSKSSVSYQDHPSGKDMCSNCAHFVPGPSPVVAGTCKVVAGKISPKGYCYAYSPISG
ncbi:MAG: iron oxidase [Acidithiobacillus sp.]